MKRMLALAMAAAMTLSLVACGQKETSPDASKSKVPTTSSQTVDKEKWVPTEDIEFVIPFGAGGGNDVMVRKMIEIIEKNKMCPVNVVPVNKKGGSGVVGYTYLTSKGTGYEYALASTSASFYTQPLMGNSPFKPDESNFSFVAHMVKDPVVIVSSTKRDFKTIQDIVDYAKAHPGELKWGGVGTASDDAIIMYMLNDAADIDITYVPYDDGGLLKSAVLGNHIDLSVASLAEAKEHMDAGTMVAIAACADERMEALSEVPTIIEEGYDIIHQQSRGIVMNANVDERVLAYYSDLFEQVAQTDEWKEFTKSNAMADAFMGYQDYSDFAKGMLADYTTYLAMVPKD